MIHLDVHALHDEEKIHASNILCSEQLSFHQFYVWENDKKLYKAILFP